MNTGSNRYFLYFFLTFFLGSQVYQLSAYSSPFSVSNVPQDSCIAALSPLQKTKDASQSVSEKVTALKMVYAFLSEGLLGGSFELITEKGEVVFLKSAEQAHRRLYTQIDSAIKNIYWIDFLGERHSLLPLSEFLKFVFKDRLDFNLQHTIDELNNHIQNSQQLEFGVFDLKDEVRGNWSLLDFLNSLGPHEVRYFVARLSSLSGHRVHPFAKMRLSPKNVHSIDNAPELGKDIFVDILAMRKSRAQMIKAESFSNNPVGVEAWEKIQRGFTESWQNAIHSLDEEPSDFFVLPVHPMQSKILSNHILELQRQGVLLATGLKVGPFQASPSFRTLMFKKSPFSRIKLPITMQMTSVVRHHSPERVAVGPLLSDFLEDLRTREGSTLSRFLRILPEPGGLILDGSFSKEKRFGLNVLYREDPYQLADSKFNMVVELNLLFQRNSESGKTLLEELIRRSNMMSGQGVREFFALYVKRVLDATLGTFLRYGVSLESHQQNTLLEVNPGSGEFKSLIQQDLAGGVELYQNIAEIYLPESIGPLRLKKSMHEDVQLPLNQQIHTTLMSHLMPVIYVLADSNEDLEEDLKQILRQNLKDLFRTVHQEKKEEELSDDHRKRVLEFLDVCERAIFADLIPIKSLLTMRLKGSEVVHVTYVDNPIFEQID